MALDFREERKWKIAMSYFLAKRIKKDKLQKKTHQKEKKNAHKLLSSHLSEEIMKFWKNFSSEKKTNSMEVEVEDEDRDIVGLIDANIASNFQEGTIKHFVNTNSEILDYSPAYLQIDRKVVVDKLKKELARWPKNKGLIQNTQFFVSLVGSQMPKDMPEELPSLKDSASYIIENKKKKKAKKLKGNFSTLNEGFDLDPLILKNFENSDELLNFFFDETEIDDNYKELFPISVFFFCFTLDSPYFLFSEKLQ